MKITRILFGFTVLTLTLLSCSHDVDERTPFQLDFEFQPLFIGMQRVYQMDSIIYDNDGQDRFETTSFLKEEITDQFVSDAGTNIYKLEISWTSNLEDKWIFLRNWSIYHSDNRLIRNEDNLRFIKLVFPPQVGATWDGNNLFDSTTNVLVSGESIEMFKNWSYEILDRSESALVGLKSYDDILTVQQADNENGIERRFSQEKYAFDIGLVSRELIILNTQCFDLCRDLSWEEKAWEGFILKQTLVDYN